MTQPNILVLHCDQLRWDCLAFNGNPDVATPNLDRCTPSRYSLWSGMYVHQHGAWDNASTFAARLPNFSRCTQSAWLSNRSRGKNAHESHLSRHWFWPYAVG